MTGLACAYHLGRRHQLLRRFGPAPVSNKLATVGCVLTLITQYQEVYRLDSKRKPRVLTSQ